jgi:hypothetical protein
MGSRAGSQPSGHEMDHREADPRLAAATRLLVVLGQPSILRQPTKCPFDDPAFRQDHEPFGAFRSLDDLQHPAGKGEHPVDQLSGITAVGPDPLQPGKRAAQLLDYQPRAIPVLKASAMHDDHQDQPEGVDGDMPLAPFDVLAFVVAVGPPFCAVFTDWLSMMAADGVGSRPSLTRTWIRNAS